jgi:hypothetical protein
MGLDVPPALEFAAALRSNIAGDLDGRARSLQRILLPDVIGSDPGLAVALELGQASVLMVRGEVNEARIMLQDAGGHIPPLLRVARDIMLAELDTSLGRPHAALRLLQNYRGDDFAIMTAIPRARAHLAPRRLRGRKPDRIRQTERPVEPPDRGGVALRWQIAQLEGESRAPWMSSRALEVAREKSSCLLPAGRRPSPPCLSGIRRVGQWRYRVRVLQRNPSRSG